MWISGITMGRIRVKGDKWILKVDGKLVAVTDEDLLKISANSKNRTIEVIGEPLGEEEV